MQAGGWERVERVLDAALEADPATWPALLDDLCAGDPELRREVEALLARVDVASGFLDSPPAAVAAAVVAEAREAGASDRYAGRQVGAYRLLRQIGRGGMSRVFLAERADGHFEQRVAVKLLRPGFDSDVNVVRFRAERQILASLNHPKIARLLDGGIMDDGLPYLVLEHVDGEPIDRYCQAHALPVRQRLELLLDVADAVEYAHRHAVVHRDLKPSNVLVTADGAVKLLDFGLAKMLEEGVTGEAPWTRTGYRWMTPEYAAPEQVRGAPATARTDVYQLGAVLYELLAGRTPFDAGSSSLHELETAILEREPEPLSRPLDADLDAIVLKAMRKAPGDRYASPRELADDIRRHLAGHPVRARRRTLGYRVRRFAGRHRLRIASAALGLLVVGTLGAALVMERASARAGTSGAAAGLPGLARARLLVESLDSAAAAVGAVDSPRARALVRRALQLSRAASTDVRRRAQLLAAAGRLEARLNLADDAVAHLQEALVLRRRLRGGDVARPAAAAPAPPTPRRLLFARPGDVYVMDEDGTHEARITHSPEAWNAYAAWAPDGRRVLLRRSVGKARPIFIVDLDGTGETELTAPPPGWFDEMPVALGGGVVFWRTDPEGRSSIYRIELDGTGLTRLTQGPRDSQVAPSPDGEFIVFVRDNDLHLLTLRDGRIRRLSHSPDRYKSGPAISPDGKQIAFTRLDPGRLEQVFVMNVDGTGTRRVSRGDFYDFLPRWSPDGRRIGFTSVRDGSNGIYSMRLDGSDVRDLSRTPGALVMRPGVSVIDVTETLTAWMAY